MPRKAKDEAAGARPQMTVAFADEEDWAFFKELARRKRVGPSILARMVLAEYMDNARDAYKDERR